MFLGTYELKLDDKGRLILPAKLREEFAAGLYLVKGQEGCIYVYTVQYFNDLVSNMDANAMVTAEQRAFMRVFMAGSRHESMDKQGRVSIAPMHRQYAALERDLIVLGIRNHLEIWDVKKWNEYQAKHEPSFTNRDGEVIPGIF